MIVASWASGMSWLMLVAAVIAGYRIAVSAVLALRVKMISIDLLVVVAAVGAVFIDNYWESAAVTFLFALGKALEAATMRKTRRALSELVEQAPMTARVLRGDGSAEAMEETVELWEVEPGDIVLVKNGEQIPVDGTIVQGAGGIDEAVITGESIPAEKSQGHKVFAGTWLRSGAVRVEAQEIGADSTLAKIIHRVEEAQDDKARTQSFLEKFSQWYTPAIMLGALLVGLVARHVELALTLLVIGCPGALVISIPVSIVAGIGRAARDGILIKGGDYLEQAAKVDAVVVDKTGTLTEGRPKLSDVLTLPGDTHHPAVTWSEEEILAMAADVESASEHPLAAAIVEGAVERGLRAEGAVSEVEDVEAIVGKGVRATVPGIGTVTVGSAALLAEGEALDAARALVAELNEQGKTAMIVGVDGQARGVVAVADAIRPEAKPAVEALHRAGITVVMATGDADAVARTVAAEVGIDEYHAQMLPESKVEVVRELAQAWHTVAMLGDGINDMPALATADVGVAMGAAGSPATIDTADIALMADRLTRLPQALILAKRTARTMRINIAIALLTVLVLMLGVFLGGVTMAIGMLVHEASVLLVIAIAMLLLRPVRGVEADQPAQPARKAAGQPTPVG
ncbi:cation-translocating P-type ATPase [Corynebacterium sp.]|uniref:heavy metal translocating P-type ATPase n=1 Tax=Corynebacterium sp. TaxID=1720 RepID=UPI0026DD4D96|nr:cation-translocating P-type ATPase [Corynebacterium sp.]MDO5032441.1 cation-translocating P-type ATPase [Corynebacterium sp.]